MKIAAVENDARADRCYVQSLAFVIVVFFCAVLFGVFALKTAGRRPRQSPVAFDFRINPNDAEYSSLVRLPGIGEARAGAIISYRRGFGRRGAAVFKSCEDLEKVRGIGPKTAGGLKEYMRFD